MSKFSEVWQRSGERMEHQKQHGPQAAMSTQEIRRKMHGMFRHLLTGTKDMAVVDAIALNTEATLMLIDKLDVYMASHPNS
jgi:hypothetical protein